MRQLLCLSLLALAGVLPASAQQPATAAPGSAERLPVRLYADACLRSLADPAMLEQLMDSIGQPLEEDSSFLQGQPGKAWLVADPFQRSHAVARQDRGLCTVFVRQGDAALLEDEFNTLGRAAPAPVQVLHQSQPSADGKRRTLQYTWHEPGQPRAVLLMMTIDPAADASLRAVISANYTDPPATGG